MATHGTKHFRLAEFACPHCQLPLVRPRLLELLEALRRDIGRPLRIISGYRCPVHNAAVGGAHDSQHMYGSAADLPAGLVPVALARAHGFTGIGIKGPWCVHVDVRDGQRVEWHY